MVCAWLVRAPDLVDVARGRLSCLADRARGASGTSMTWYCASTQSAMTATSSPRARKARSSACMMMVRASCGIFRAGQCADDSSAASAPAREQIRRRARSSSRSSSRSMARSPRRSRQDPRGPAPICSRDGGVSDLTNDEPSRYAERLEAKRLTPEIQVRRCIEAARDAGVCEDQTDFDAAVGQIKAPGKAKGRASSQRR